MEMSGKIWSTYIQTADRIKSLHENKKKWDISVSMLMIARGYKPIYG